MKIKIGNYLSHWTTTRFENWWLEKRSGKHIFDMDDYVHTPLDKFVEKICDFWQDVLNYTINKYFFIKERDISIHIDKWDTWSMDHTLALIILPMLTQLHATKQGSPMTDDDDVPEELRSHNAPDHEEWETDDLVHLRWDWIMAEMIWSFKQIVDTDNDAQFHSGKIEFERKPIEGSNMIEMVKGKNDTHVFDSEGHTKHYERIQRGTILFGKYFRGLWT